MSIFYLDKEQVEVLIEEYRKLRNFYGASIFYKEFFDLLGNLFDYIENDGTSENTRKRKRREFTQEFQDGLINEVEYGELMLSVKEISDETKAELKDIARKSIKDMMSL